MSQSRGRCEGIRIISVGEDWGFHVAVSPSVVSRCCSSLRGARGLGLHPKEWSGVLVSRSVVYHC